MNIQKELYVLDSNVFDLDYEVDIPLSNKLGILTSKENRDSVLTRFWKENQIPWQAGRDLMHAQSAKEASKISGLYLEFGVLTGYSLQLIAKLNPTKTIYGFDSFYGYREEFGPFTKGSYNYGGTPPSVGYLGRKFEVPNNAKLVIGYFEDTLDNFLIAHPDEKVAFIHIDCDLYSSTSHVFNMLHKHNKLQPGTVIQFHTFFFRGVEAGAKPAPGKMVRWYAGEFDAWMDFITEHSNIKFSYLGSQGLCCSLIITNI